MSHHVFFQNLLLFQWHPNFEICQIINHPCDFLIGGEKISADTGDIIVINSRTVHQFIPLFDNTLIRILHFPQRLLLTFPDNNTMVKTHIKADEIKRVEGLEETLLALFEILQKEPREIKCENNPFFASLASAVYQALKRNFPSDEISHKRATEEKMFFEIVDYINLNFKNELTFISLSEAMFISRKKTSELFKKYSGISINQYIATLRVSFANQLMLKGESITEVALASGFGSIRTFNNVYKSVTGTTPSHYIKTAKIK